MDELPIKKVSVAYSIARPVVFGNISRRMSRWRSRARQHPELVTVRFEQAASSWNWS